MMKTLFAAGAVSKSRGSVTSQTPNGLPNFTDGNIRGGNPTLTGCEVRHWQMTIKIGFTVKE